MDFFEYVRRLAITALFSDDVLVNQLVLKGGTAMALVHRIGLRASFDIDFSLRGDFEDVREAEARAKRALEQRFDSAGYTVFDFSFCARPTLKERDERPWWGGYELRFKLLKHDDFDRIEPRKRSIQATVIGPIQKRTLCVEISKNEYVEGQIEKELDHYAIHVYTPAMVAAEKLRALCQQMPEYSLRGESARRARDFYDIYLAVTRAHVDLSSSENSVILREMFAAKKVPMGLLSKLISVREFHRPDWPSVVAAVPETLEEFDFYFDFVMDQVATLKVLRNV